MTSRISCRKSSRPRISRRPKVKGAIKTDFILSAEIMTIVLAALPELSLAG